ncbi:MAG: hypothetical protein COU27_02910 [Candidatus Levybacteria bacterium CG10_big_fil_rev_8_21_14_0_10_36_7]|nr:MAG: hypothetical protein COU27_02910 [Candidatus Levybacteria bacterium CG10_big_fil_rev_8_21_14_0_10_36_7]
MTDLISFFTLLLAGLLFASVFSKLHIPWVISLIVGGIIIGPHGLKIFTPNDTMAFLSEIGLIFLMFMAGMETRLSSFKAIRKGVGIIAVLNGIIPFF